MKSFIRENKQAVISFAILAAVAAVTLFLAVFCNEVTPGAVLCL